MWFHKKEASWLTREGMFPALGIVGYVTTFSLLITRASKFMSEPKPPLGPMMFLTLFCFSVLTCGLIVFYKPYLLFIDKKGKEAGQLILSTTKWLGVFALATIVLVAFMSR